MTTAPGQDRKPTSFGRKRMLRLILIGFVVFGCAFAFSRLAAPYLISSSVVRTAIASAVATWTGHDVLIEGTPAISFWPEPRVTLNQVTILKRGNGQRELLGKIGSLSASFGLWSAVRGNPQFEDFRFVRPQMRVSRNLEGHLDWTDEGLLSAAVRNAVANDDGSQRLDPAHDAAVGNVSVVDGEVTLIDEATATSVRISDVNANLEWPHLGGELSARGSLLFEGELFRFGIDMRQPLLMLAGHPAQLSVDLRSETLAINYSGVADLVHLTPGTGRLTVDATSLETIRQWTGIRIAGAESWKMLKLTADVSTIEDVVRFDHLAFTINGISGTGLLDLRRSNEAKPKLTGTIALEQIDLRHLATAFNLDADRRYGVRPPGVAHWLDLDITLSARRGSIGPVELGEIATSIMTPENTTKLLIADAALFGGRINASFSGIGDSYDQGASFRVSLEEADLGQLTRMLDLNGPLPNGIGSLELIGTVNGPLFSAGPEDVSGSVSLTMRNGALPAFDLSGLRQLADEKAYFQLGAAGGGDFSFRQFSFFAEFAEGAAEIGKASFVSDEVTLNFSGIIPFSSGGIAVTGAVVPKPDPDSSEDPSPVEWRFFLGGSWRDPVVTPFPYFR